MSSALVLDSGALIAIERDDRPVLAQLEIARQDEWELRVPAMVVAQVWRDGRRQANVARWLRAMAVQGVDEHTAKLAGALCRQAGTSDPIDATVVLAAGTGDRILTSDPADITHLARANELAVTVVAC